MLDLFFFLSLLPCFLVDRKDVKTSSSAAVLDEPGYVLRVDNLVESAPVGDDTIEDEARALWDDGFGIVAVGSGHHVLGTQVDERAEQKVRCSSLQTFFF